MQLSTFEQTNSLSLLNLFHNFKGGLLLLCIVLILNVGNKSYGRKVAVEVGGKKMNTMSYHYRSINEHDRSVMIIAIMLIINAHFQTLFA